MAGSDAFVRDDGVLGMDQSPGLAPWTEGVLRTIFGHSVMPGI